MSISELSPPSPFIIVFGRDTAGKPHASWFDQASAELARKAAGLMNMRAVAIETDALRELAGALPRGRVFSSGRAFTPLVKGKLYERLVEGTRDLLGLANDDVAPETAPETECKPSDQPAAAEPQLTDEQPKPDEAGKAALLKPAHTKRPDNGQSAAPAKRPSNPSEIGMGSVALATTGAEEGWYEAEVIGVNGAMFTCKWRDYPSEPTFVRRRHEFGFLPAMA